MSRGALQKLQRRSRYENDPNLYFVPSQKKDPKIDPHFSNLKSRESLFRRVSLMMMMIAFITFKSSLVPLFEGL